MYLSPPSHSAVPASSDSVSASSSVPVPLIRIFSVFRSRSIMRSTRLMMKKPAVKTITMQNTITAVSIFHRPFLPQVQSVNRYTYIRRETPAMPSDSEAFLDILISAQYQQCFPVIENRIRCDIQIQFAVSFYRHDIDPMFFADIKPPDAFSVHSSGMEISKIA